MAIAMDNSHRSSVETVKEAMSRLKIGRARLYDHLNAGTIESYLEGRRRKVFSRSVDTFILLKLLAEAEGRKRRPRDFKATRGD